MGYEVNPPNPALNGLTLGTDAPFTNTRLTVKATAASTYVAIFEDAADRVIARIGTTGRIDTTSYSAAGDTGGPPLVMQFVNTAPANNDILGHVAWIGNDSVGDYQSFAAIHGVATNVTAATRNSKLRFGVMSNVSGGGVANQPNLFMDFDAAGGLKLSNVPLSQVASIELTAGAVDAQGFIKFYDLSTLKWTMAKQADHSFIHYHDATGKTALAITAAGVTSLGETGTTGNTLVGNWAAAGTFGLATSTPASAAAAGVAGTITWDAGFIYVCTATNTWKRILIATW